MIKQVLLLRVPVLFLSALHGVGSAMPLEGGAQGVWSGTLGNSAIVACFDARSDDGQRHGSYYYVRYLVPIALTPRTVEGEWTDRSVTLQLPRDFAGAGASGAEDGSRTWNAVSGGEIDPWHWFGVASDRSADLPLPVVSRTGVLPAKLKDYLVKAAHASGDCRALYDESSSAGIHVSAAGVEFLLGDTLRPECMRTVFVSPEAILPFLSEQGKAELRWLTKQ